MYIFTGIFLFEIVVFIGSHPGARLLENTIKIHNEEIDKNYN